VTTASLDGQWSCLCQAYASQQTSSDGGEARKGTGVVDPGGTMMCGIAETAGVPARRQTSAAYSA
jgi:hypothetical protein